jgi:hypothetical protein
MKDDTRKTPIAKPTEERTSDQSTPSASGLTAGRERANRESDDRDETEDVAARTGRGEEIPRRYEDPADDKVMPPNDSTLKINI